jgi:CheY-like chemotaxis protein
MTAKIRVLVADDERPSRLFLITALSAFVEIEVIAEAKSGKEALHLIETLHPDVAFLDIHAGNRWFRSPGTPPGLEAAYRVRQCLRRTCRSNRCTERGRLFVEARGSLLSSPSFGSGARTHDMCGGSIKDVRLTIRKGLFSLGVRSTARYNSNRNQTRGDDQQ